MTDDVARAGAARQLFPDAGAVGHRAHRAAAARRAAALHAVPGEGGRLNRAIEFLPSDEEIAERRANGHGPRRAPSARCCSPTARSGSTTSSSASTLPDDPWVGDGARALLPAALRETLRGVHAAPSAEARDHRDARHQQHGEPRRQHVRAPARRRRPARAPHEIVRAYLLSREIFGFVALWKAIEALDNKVDDARAVGDADRHEPASSSAARRGSCARGGWPRTWRRRSRTSAPRVEALAARLPTLLDAASARARRRGGRATTSAQGVPRDARDARGRRSTRCTRRSTSSRSRRDEAAGRSSSPRSTSTLATRLELPWLREMIARAAGRRALADARADGDAGRPVRAAADDRRARCWQGRRHLRARRIARGVARSAIARADRARPASDGRAARRACSRCGDARRSRCASCATCELAATRAARWRRARGRGATRCAL